MLLAQVHPLNVYVFVHVDVRFKAYINCGHALVDTVTCYYQGNRLSWATQLYTITNLTTTIHLKHIHTMITYLASCDFLCSLLFSSCFFFCRSVKKSPGLILRVKQKNYTDLRTLLLALSGLFLLQVFDFFFAEWTPKWLLGWHDWISRFLFVFSSLLLPPVYPSCAFFYTE